MKRFKLPRQVQKFLSNHDPVANFFHFTRDSHSATDRRVARAHAFALWADIIGSRLSA